MEAVVEAAVDNAAAAEVPPPVDVARVEALISSLDPVELEQAFAAEGGLGQAGRCRKRRPWPRRPRTSGRTADVGAGGLSVVPDLTEEHYEGTGTEE